MILTVTPNASIDKTYVVDGFGIDRIHRPSTITSSPGGKGINVLRVFQELGGSGCATGFIGGRVGDTITEGLDALGIEHRMVRVNKESRLCIKVLDPSSGTQTELNETGPDIDAHEVELLSKRIESMLNGVDWLVLSGNVPPGVPVSFYGDMIRLAKSRGVKTVLDASDEQLIEGVAAGPFMVKPNVHELSHLADQELVTIEEICSAAKSLKQYGINIVSVTVGRSGAMVTDGTHAWQATPPQIDFASAVGSGDSFVAGFLYELSSGGTLADALALGTAAGAANATTYDAGSCSKSSIMDIRRGVVLSDLF
ncbi:MAG: 1-phosphofructokinase [Armatimonadetes bacterium]|nr:1-phosphofructokinase [Armatimonadota bacterium]